MLVKIKLEYVLIVASKVAAVEIQCTTMYIAHR